MQLRARVRSSYLGQHLVHLGRTLSLLLGGAGILTVVGIVQLVEGARHRSPWFWLFLGAALVAIAEASAVHRDLRAGPQIRFVGTDAADAFTVSRVPGTTGIYALNPPPGGHVIGGPAPSRNRFVRALVANDPGHRVGECARRVAATITFLDDSGEPLLQPMIGRWAETPQRAETGRIGLSLDEAQLDIEANGLPHALDVAMKVAGQSEFYAFNYENSDLPDLRLERHRLIVPQCSVRIAVRPANGRPITSTFVLHNDREDLSLTQTDDAIHST